MKKKLKRTGAMLLTLVLLAASMPAGVFAAGAESGEDAVAMIPVAGAEDLTYPSLEAAIADSYPEDVIYLLTDYTLAESVTIPRNVRVVIPSSPALDDTLTGNNVNEAVTSGSAYVTLTIPEGKTLTVNGTLLVAGNQQSVAGDSGCLTGDYGRIALSGDLVVNSALYARGEISGSGTVTANSGSSVYQLFQIHDWRGGTASLNAYNNQVFPFNLYEFTNITAKTVYQCGSSLRVQFYLYTNSTDTVGEVTIIDENGQFGFVNAASVASGNITFTHDNGITTVTVNGEVKTGDIAVVISQNVFGKTVNYNINSALTVCPFGYNMNVVVADGATLEIGNRMKLLPGCTVTVEEGGSAVVDSGAALYFYGEGGYSRSYNNIRWPAGTKSAPAVLDVKGTLTNNGVIGSTSSTLSNTPYACAAPVEDTAIVEEVTQSNTAISLVDVTFYTTDT